MGNTPARYYVVTVPERGRHGPACPWAPGRRSKISLVKEDAERFQQHLVKTRPLSVAKTALVMDQGWWFTDWKTPATQLDADDFKTIMPVPAEFSTIF
jgi:hypothetical protein